MLTCKSPRKVMWYAHELACRCLPKYSSKFSRHDYTLPQLFACLVVREHQNKSYRGTEALLRDTSWCRQIGMASVPDHNTLCHAFHLIMGSDRRVDRMLDRLARWMHMACALGEVCAIDSTLYDTHHHSRHYENRCRHYASSVKSTANSRRSRAAKRLPKLGLGIDTTSHLIVGARTRIGLGSDAPDFLPLLRHAKHRMPSLKTVLADAGYDSHENHRQARQQLKVHTLIKCGVGRPSDKPPVSGYRRTMRKQLAGSQKGKRYAQRAQAETVNSMMKRNLGDALRAKTPQGRRREQMLRVLTHNIMLLLSRQDEG
jgi:hypothetical protein